MSATCVPFYVWRANTRLSMHANTSEVMDYAFSKTKDDTRHTLHKLDPRKTHEMRNLVAMALELSSSTMIPHCGLCPISKSHPILTDRGLSMLSTGQNHMNLEDTGGC